MSRYPNSFLSDLFGTQTTTYRIGRRGKPSTKQVSTITYKGYKIFYDKSVDGWFIPQIDRESMFESKKEAKRFIDDEVKIMGRSNWANRPNWANPQSKIKETVLVIKNPDDWFARCIEGVRKSGGGYDPGAVCASVRRKKQARYMYK